jgi:hypothetical protein
MYMLVQESKERKNIIQIERLFDFTTNQMRN